MHAGEIGNAHPLHRPVMGDESAGTISHSSKRRRTRRGRRRRRAEGVGRRSPSNRWRKRKGPLPTPPRSLRSRRSPLQRGGKRHLCPGEIGHAPARAAHPRRRTGFLTAAGDSQTKRSILPTRLLYRPQSAHRRVRSAAKRTPLYQIPSHQADGQKGGQQQPAQPAIGGPRLNVHRGRPGAFGFLLRRAHG